ncbi:hypothetical protein HOLleu_10249 [Holothuria leucospilota]|uniref:Uncharacterized protein n=1 Tax=Holothuria leucospilota TaxID=206669 RepID=A0A9Q1CDE2_HOLLE|nr:hypothetical protein HOLleu_10249 [Holothuria leucospilota]
MAELEFDTRKRKRKAATHSVEVSESQIVSALDNLSFLSRDRPKFWRRCKPSRVILIPGWADWRRLAELAGKERDHLETKRPWSAIVVTNGVIMQRNAPTPRQWFPSWETRNTWFRGPGTG